MGGGDNELIIKTALDAVGFEKGSKKLMSAIRGLSSSLKNAFGRIVGAASVFAVLSRAISTFMSQNQELSKQVGAIWTTLGNALGPIITQIVNWVSLAVSYLVELMRLLGLTAKTASDASKAAQGAGGALQKTVAGFDELNKLSAGGGGGGAGTLQDVDPVDWMEELAEALKSKAWDKAADIIVDKFNELIDAAKKKAKELGKKIGEYLGGALKIAARVIKGVNWKGIGDAIAKFFNGLLEEIDGEDLGTILVGKLTIAFGMLTGFLENFDFEQFADFISRMIIGAFETVGEAIAKADFRKIGENIRKFFARLWENREEIAEAIFGALRAAWDAALDLLWGLISSDDKEPPLIKSLDGVRESVEKLWDVVKEKAGEIWDKLSPILEKAIDTWLPEFFDQLADAISDLADILSGKMNFGEFLANMSGLEKVLLILSGIKLVGLIRGLGSVVTKITGPVFNAFFGGEGGGLIGWLSKAVLGFGDVAGEAVGASGALAGIAGDATGAAGGILGLAGEIGALLPTLGLVAGAAALAGVAIYSIVDYCDYIDNVGFLDMSASVEDCAENVDRLAASLEEAKVQEQLLIDSGGVPMGEVDQATIAYMHSVEQLGEKMGYTREQMEILFTYYGTSSEALSELKKHNDDLIKSMTEEKKSVEEISAELGLSAEYVAAQVEQNLALAEATQQTAQTGTELTEANRELSQEQRRGAESADKLREGTENVGEGFTNLETTVSDAAENMRTDFIENMDEMGDEGSSTISEINSEFSYNFGILSSNAYYWGRDLIINFNNGMVNAVNSVLVPTMENIAQAIKNYIGFSEPEKGPLSDFHTYAPDMMKLFADGIDKNEDKVLKSVGNLAGGISDAIDGGDYDIAIGTAAQFDSAMDGFADKVVAGFSDLIDRLQAIAENVTFSMPAMAGGGIVPYGVAGGSSTGGYVGGGSSSDNMASLMSEFRNALNNITFVAQFGDLKALAKRITTIQKETERAGG